MFSFSVVERLERPERDPRDESSEPSLATSCILSKTHEICCMPRACCARLEQICRVQCIQPVVSPEEELGDAYLQSKCEFQLDTIQGPSR